MLSIVIASFVIILFGIIDDINPMKARYKLIGQLIAAGIIVFYGNIILKEVYLFDYYYTTKLAKYKLLRVILEIFTILKLVNCMNGNAKYRCRNHRILWQHHFERSLSFRLLYKFWKLVSLFDDILHNRLYKCYKLDRWTRRTRSNIGIAKIMIGTTKLLNVTFLNPSNEMIAMMNPKNWLPVSPMKILAGGKLKTRNPRGSDFMSLVVNGHSVIMMALVSFMMSLLLVPICKKVSIHINAMDIPMAMQNT